MENHVRNEKTVAGPTWERDELPQKRTPEDKEDEAELV